MSRPLRRSWLLCSWFSTLTPIAIAEAGERCTDEKGPTLWLSPDEPVAGRPVRIVAVGDVNLQGASIELAAPGRDKGTPLLVTTRGGPPWSAVAVIEAAPAGRHEARVRLPSGAMSCRRFDVSRRRDPEKRRRAAGTGWPSRRLWDARTEDFYASWIEALFDGAPGETVEFRPLAQALRDPGRNVLFDHLGLGEDDPANKQALPAAPDCADLPYFLRAYFAWKMLLPFGFRDCDRGTATRPPACRGLVTNEFPPPATGVRDGDPLRAFRRFLFVMRNTVHSGSARTALHDEETDFVPLELSRQSLRPGTIYADPYGHVLVVARWFPQDDARAGLLYAVDGQPDASIGRKRFWQGNFLFASDVAASGAGFKAFRALGREPATGTLRTLRNDELKTPSSVVRFSDRQGKLKPDEFYAQLERLINPRGIDPESAYEEMLAALVEQMQARVRSVANGEENMRTTSGDAIAMPEGARIFETVGPWEDFATPSRDMRLLIALRVLASLPAQITARPDLFALRGRAPADARKAVEERHGRRTKETGIEYLRSDGAPFRVTVADLLQRRTALEMAYNPNDCPEVRWGAREGTSEISTCRRRAPPEQRQRMTEYRPWFAEARRPPRP